ncbi:MAG TPA: FHA domain-containing protein [Anaerolineae bacterium]|jgi:hypothetical protein|nr:FHA domain-containing protein [Anaerolineae bacterium]
MQLVTWWYDWGLFLIAFIDLLIIVWVLYDSSVREGQSAGWRLGVIAPALLLIPAAMFRFAGPATQVNLVNLAEPFFWVGLVGGIVPIIVAVGYILSITGDKAEPQAVANVCPIHGQFDPRYASCPVCAAEVQARQVRAEPAEREARTRVGAAVPGVSRAPRVAKAGALLYMETGARAGTDYRLNVGSTAIGRASDSEVVLDDDTASRQHALIREDHGHFTLQDRGSLDGTYLNGEKIRGAVTLQDGDEIGLGNTVLRFKIL